MGYTTTFYGKFKLSRKLTDEEFTILINFSNASHNHIDHPNNRCSWAPSLDGKNFEWNGVEKFYNAIEWLEFVIDKFFEPWDILLNGDVKWKGEDENDKGIISIKDSIILPIKKYPTGAYQSLRK